MAGIELRGIVKRFGEVEVIPKLDLDIRDGKITVLLGPSGCGKSTLLRIIAGLESPTEGDVAIGGRAVNDVPPADRGCALVFQNYALYPHKTVRNNLAFPLRMAKVPVAEQASRVDDIARLLELTPLLERYPRQLSGGQRQRVAMGRAMIRKPEVFLYDEPLSNLDLELRVRLRLEIARMQHALGATTVYVTHDQTEAMTLADQIVVLRRGRIEQVGAPLELYRHPANLFVAGFIGTPKMNFFAVEKQDDDETGSTIRLAGQVLKLARRLPVRAKTMGFRPERARIGGGSSGELGLDVKNCETQAIEHLGDRAYAYLRCSLGELVVITPDADAPIAGDVRLALDEASLHFFDDEERAIHR